MHENKIISLSLGDSKSILGVDNWAGFVPICLSVEHNTSNRDEINRVLKEGGIIQPLIDMNGNFIGPDRVWNKTMKVPGLQVTRGFGDLVGKDCGVSGKPGLLFLFLY